MKTRVLHCLFTQETSKGYCITISRIIDNSFFSKNKQNSISSPLSLFSHFLYMQSRVPCCNSSGLLDIVYIGWTEGALENTLDACFPPTSTCDVHSFTPIPSAVIKCYAVVRTVRKSAHLDRACSRWPCRTSGHSGRTRGRCASAPASRLCMTRSPRATHRKSADNERQAIKRSVR